MTKGRSTVSALTFNHTPYQYLMTRIAHGDIPARHRWWNIQASGRRLAANP